MHHIYHTEGIILSSNDLGESNKYYFIITPDLGMICATAQGVRKISSKLRYVLQDFNYIKIDLIKGKNLWRIKSALKTNKLENLSNNKDIFIIVNNISRLLRRLLVGEEPNRDLFFELLDGLYFLENTEEKGYYNDIEIVLVLRILDRLGYFDGEGFFRNIIKSPFVNDILPEVNKNKKQILFEINNALKESHL